MKFNDTLKLSKILEVIDLYRGIVMDSVEQEFGDHPNWKYLRARLLKAFGDRGLTKRVQDIMNDENND